MSGGIGLFKEGQKVRFKWHMPYSGTIEKEGTIIEALPHFTGELLAYWIRTKCPQTGKYDAVVVEASDIVATWGDCECGKDTKNFAGHMFFCSKYPENFKK